MEPNAKKISMGEAVQFGWDTMKGRFWFFAGMVALLFALSAVNGAAQKHGAASAIVGLIVWLMSILVGAGIQRIALKTIDGQPTGFGDLFPFDIYWKYLGTTLLVMLVVLGGFILLIVPGIVWALKYGYANYLVVDKGLAGRAALVRSAEITQGAKGRIFLFGILLFLINLLGFIVIFVGCFAAIPLTFLASAYVYRKLAAATA